MLALNPEPLSLDPSCIEKWILTRSKVNRLGFSVTWGRKTVEITLGLAASRFRFRLGGGVVGFGLRLCLQLGFGWGSGFGVHVAYVGYGGLRLNSWESRSI